MELSELQNYSLLKSLENLVFIYVHLYLIYFQASSPLCAIKAYIIEMFHSENSIWASSTYFGEFWSQFHWYFAIIFTEKERVGIHQKGDIYWQ